MSTKKKAPAKKAAKRETPGMDEYGLTPQQRLFADLFLKPMPAVHAYKRAFPGCTDATAYNNGSRMLTYPTVKAYLAAERKRMAEANAIEKNEAIGFLVRILRAAPDHVDGESDLAQEMTEEEMAGEVLKRRIKLPSKIDAVKQLAQMLGWNEPEKVKHEFEVVIGPGANA